MWSLIEDLKFGLRMLRRSPGFAATAVLTLGAGVGLTTAVFSLFHAYFLQPLPFQEPERLVHVWQTDGKLDFDSARMSVPNYEDLRSRSQTFTDFGGYFYGTRVLGSEDGVETIRSTWMTPNMLDVLGVPPAIGRAFEEDEAVDGADRVALLSDRFWRRQFAGRTEVVGEEIQLEGEPYTVIGVMPETFVMPFNDMDVWLPLALEPYRDQRQGNGPLLVIGRMADGETPASAQAELTALMAQIEADHPATNEEVGANVVDLRSQLLFVYDMFKVVFPALLAALGFVLLIVCANLANLILARSQDRAHEMAFRQALGADRGRLVRQLLTENAVVGLLGAALGLVLAVFLCRALDRSLPLELYRADAIDVDGPAFLFALALALVSSLVFGLAPALQSSSARLASVIKDGARGSGGGRASVMRNVFVVTQIALAVLLVTGSGLMIKTFSTLQSVELGFEPERLLTFEVTLSRSRYPGDPEEISYYQQVVDRVRSVPGVESVASIYPLPLNHESHGTEFEVAGREPDGEGLLYARRMWIDGEWFETAGIPLLSGRTFGAEDGAETAPVVVVNRLLAERLWPDRSAVGQRLEIDEVSREIVGVVENSIYLQVDEEPEMALYYPQQQVSTARRFIIARTAGDPMAAWNAIEAAAAPVDPLQPLETVRPMQEVVAVSLMAWMMGIGGISALGIGALVLAALGLYGVVRYSVAQRGHEFGIRSALGAGSSDIVRLVLTQGLRLVAVGLAVGLVAALVLTRFLQSLLFGVAALDPAIFLMTPLVLLVVALIATWGPARRAASSDPMAVLRAD